MAKAPRIYIVATDVPSLKGGAAVRNVHLIRQYLRHGWEVTLFCLYTPATEGELDALRKHSGLTVRPLREPELTPAMMARAILMHRVMPYMEQYRQSHLAAALLDACGKEMPDAIQFEEMTAYDAVAPGLAALRPKPFLILDAHNVEQETLAHAFTSFSLPRRLGGNFVLPHIRRLENNAARTVDMVLACSDDDAKYFRRMARKVVTVPNGADLSHFERVPTKLNETLLFMGGTSYPPNEEALKWYFSEIHPRVLERKPGIKILILGSKPPDWLVEMAQDDPTIMLSGYVADVRDELAKASVCISPMLGGSGTSLKILEYMASSKAVVSTTVGARGIAYTKNRNILIADDAGEFAANILAALDSDNEYRRLAHNGRVLMEQSYDWDQIGDDLNKRLARLS